MNCFIIHIIHKYPAAVKKGEGKIMRSIRYLFYIGRGELAIHDRSFCKFVYVVVHGRDNYSIVNITCEL
jgi:hypothetical protein